MIAQRKILLPLLLILFAASCTRYKDIVYLQSADSDFDSAGMYPYEMPTYKIQNRDILYIRIVSMNREVSDIMNLTPSSSVNLYNTEASFYIYGYNVNDSGYIEMPVIGRIKVAGKTMEEAKLSITEKVLQYLKEPTVIVKLISFKYSVLGEVIRPGAYQNYNNQLTVLEAISQAGDISPFGDRRKILVIRPVVNGTQTFRLDLTSTKILHSKGYYILPNDIVYVEPVKTKNFRNNIPTLTLILASITTFILVLNYVNPK